MGSTRPRPDSNKIAFLNEARWFQQKGSKVESIELVDSTCAMDGWRLGFYEISFADIDPELYLILTDEDGSTFKPIDDPSFMRFFFDKFAKAEKIRTGRGTITFDKLGDWTFDAAKSSYQSLPGVSSNSLVVRKGGGKAPSVAKFMRRLRRGENVEAQINKHIFSGGKFFGAPVYRASASYIDDDARTYHVATLFDFVENEGSAWEWTLGYLSGFIGNGVTANSDFSKDYVVDSTGSYCDRVFNLGTIVASLHIALAANGDDAFGMRKIEKIDIGTWRQNWLAQFDRTLGFMEKSDIDSAELKGVLEKKGAMRNLFEGADEIFLKLGYKIRQHGDFHLGQVLVGDDNFYVIDFEGEPLKPYSERAIHYPALKDVAGMMRSFNYAAFSAYFDAREKYADEPLCERIKGACRIWESRARESFLDGYYSKLKRVGAKFLPFDDEETIDAALRVLMMDKALYEVEYEINNRPDWLPIPLGGILEALKSHNS